MMRRFLVMRTLGLAATLAGWGLLLGLVLPPDERGFIDPAAATAIGERLAVTAPLTLMILLLALSGGLPIVLKAARQSGRPVDTILGWTARVFTSPMPVWLGMVLVVVVAGMLRWVPAGGFMPWHQNPGGAFSSLLLPAIAVALPLAAAVARLGRSAFAAIDEWPDVFAARAQGMPAGEAALRHGVPRALAGLAPLAGPLFAAALAGAMVVETVFYLPGLGRLLVESISGGADGSARTLIMWMIAATAIVQFAADALRRAIDPAQGEPKVSAP